MMKLNKKKIRQEKLARLFYEMGMDIDLVSKRSGVNVEKVMKLANKKS